MNIRVIELNAKKRKIASEKLIVALSRLWSCSTFWIHLLTPCGRCGLMHCGNSDFGTVDGLPNHLCPFFLLYALCFFLTYFLTYLFFL